MEPAGVKVPDTVFVPATRAPVAVANVKPLDVVAVRFAVFPTTTSVAPAACAGVTAVSWAELTKVTEAAATARVASTNDTVAPLANPVPEIVTVVPPEVGPVEGLTVETVGVEAPTFGNTQAPTLPSR